VELTPMRSYEILEQASQSSRRTIADALAVLETEAAFGEDDTAQIRIGQLPLPSRETVGLVLVIFEVPCTDKGYAVPLPTATQFYADHGSSRRVLFDVGLFDEAICYRSLREDGDPSIAPMVPDLKILDASRLAGLYIPSINSIEAYLAQRYPAARVPSLQKIADTLADFGMRFPRHTRASLSHRPATK